VEEKLRRGTLEALAELGFSGLTVEAICAGAGLPRTNFYRRWSSPTEAVLEAVRESADVSAPPSTGGLVKDIVEFCVRQAQAISDPLMGDCIDFLQAEGALNRELRKRLEGMQTERRAYTRVLISREAHNGDALVIDADLLIDMAVGQTRFRSSQGKKVSRADWTRIVRALVRPAST
jgi:AcrR family transcriptional regulator